MAGFIVAAEAPDRPGASQGQGRGDQENSTRESLVPRFQNMHKRKDADKDGVLTIDEFVGRETGENLFHAIDANGDGKITAAEARAADIVNNGQGKPKTIKFEGKEWSCKNSVGAKVKEYKGKTALHIVSMGKINNVYLPITDFRNGVIEVDIAGESHSGVTFRGIEDGQKAEKLYFRPQFSGTQRHKQTVQYCVLGKPEGDWPYLRKNFPNKYETGVDIKQGEWFHVRLVIKDKSLKLYVNDSKSSVIIVDPLLDDLRGGSVGVWGWDSYFANFKYTKE
jgi:hypothetical protein